MVIEQKYKFEKRFIDENLIFKLYSLILNFLESNNENLDELEIILNFTDKTYKMGKLEYDKFNFPNDTIDGFFFYHTSLTMNSLQDLIFCSVKKHEERSKYLFGQVKQILNVSRTHDEVNGSSLDIKVITKSFTGKILTEKEIQKIYTQLQEFLWKTNPSSTLSFQISTHKGEQFYGDSSGQLKKLVSKITDYVTSFSLTSLSEVSFRYHSNLVGDNLLYEIKGNEKMVEDIDYQLNGIILNAKDIPLVSKIASKAGYVSVFGFFITWGWIRSLPKINRSLSWFLLGLSILWVFGMVVSMFNRLVFPCIELDFPGFSNDNKNYPKYNRKIFRRIIAFIITAICLPILINIIS